MTKLNRQKWLKIGAITLAGGVLVGALGYYNFLYKDTVGALLLDECPNFTLDYIYSGNNGEMTIDESKTFTMADQSGKVVVLNFWATYCQPCIKEIPHFNQFYETYKNQGLEVVILNNELIYTAQQLLDGYINNPANEYYENYYSKWPTYTCTFGKFDSNNDIFNMFEVSPALPVTIVVNKAGIITYMRSGSLSEQDLEDIVFPLLAE